MPRAAPVIAMVLPLMLSMRPNFTRVKFVLEAPSGPSSTVPPKVLTIVASRVSRQLRPPFTDAHVKPRYVARSENFFDQGPSVCRGQSAAESGAARYLSDRDASVP